MLNDLLMLTKFNRNAESERAARSVAVEELGYECDEREEGKNDRPFGAKTRWRILKNNTRLSPLPRSLSLGPSAILHSRGGLPPSSHPEEDPPLPPRRASFILGRDLGGPKNGRLKGREGEKRRKRVFTLHPVRSDAMRSDAGERGCRYPCVIT